MLRSLRAVDFRCFPSLELELPEEGALLVGPNAQGKTSVLEAVCLLARLHSPRSERMQPLARLGGGGGFGVAGEAWGMERRIDWMPHQPLRMRVNGEMRAGRGAYLEDGGLVVWMGGGDLELVRGAGAGRRRYLDFLGSQVEPEYRRALGRYRRAMRAKNLLLKEGGARRRAEIESYEAVMLRAASVLRRTRASITSQLGGLVAAWQRTISGRDEQAGAVYVSGGDLADEWAMAREREFQQRRSLVGPHRDELELTVNGLPAANFASEGQQRTLALALKLAQGEVLRSLGGKEPVWLIDDIFGELDASRRNALMRALPRVGQKWITTTGLDWLRETPELSGLARFQVNAGNVR